MFACIVSASRIDDDDLFEQKPVIISKVVKNLVDGSSDPRTIIVVGVGSRENRLAHAIPSYSSLGLQNPSRLYHTPLSISLQGGDKLFEPLNEGGPKDVVLWSVWGQRSTTRRAFPDRISERLTLRQAKLNEGCQIMTGNQGWLSAAKRCAARYLSRHIVAKGMVSGEPPLREMALLYTATYYQVPMPLAEPPPTAAWYP